MRRVTALVEREHGWATAFWEAVGFEFDPRMARYVRNLPCEEPGDSPRLSLGR